MARRVRQTEPLDTLSGVVTEYAQIEELLSAGEFRGRAWVLDRSNRTGSALATPTDHDILDLHRAMFGDFIPWAGTTRVDERGPGGNVPIPAHDVRAALRTFTQDLAAWVAALATIDTAAISVVIADAHHRFQWIHPFPDTNGRTGRVLDHYLLWVTFGLHGGALTTSPSIEYFPSASHEDAYYDGLAEADNGRPEALRAFYLERLLATFELA